MTGNIAASVVSSGNVASRAKAVRSLLDSDRSRFGSRLVSYLRDRSPVVRSAALERIAEEGISEAEDEVLQSLSDRSGIVRYAAVEALGALREGSQDRAAWLYPLLSDKKTLVRIETLESLARMEDEAALPMIAELLEDQDELVRSYAAWAIAHLRGEKYISTLGHRLQVEQSEIAAVGLSDALFSLGDSTQFPKLLKLLSSSNYLVRCASANALSALPLDQTQLRSAIEAVSHAAQNALVRGDRSTMERVEKELRER